MSSVPKKADKLNLSLSTSRSGRVMRLNFVENYIIQNKVQVNKLINNLQIIIGVILSCWHKQIQLEGERTGGCCYNVGSPSTTPG